jgi:hypothetical protein
MLCVSVSHGGRRFTTGSKEREDDDGKESEEKGEQEESRSGAQEEENREGVGKKDHKKDRKAGSAEAQSRAQKGAGPLARARTCSVLAEPRHPRNGRRREQLTVFRSQQRVNRLRDAAARAAASAPL